MVQEISGATQATATMSSREVKTSAISSPCLQSGAGVQGMGDVRGAGPGPAQVRTSL